VIRSVTLGLALVAATAGAAAPKATTAPKTASAPKAAHVAASLNTTDAPADEYFGRTKLSPIGVRNELTRIGRYLDAGWGGRMTKDTMYVVDSLDDWQHQYPRDYELPRLYKRAYDALGREDTTEAKTARQQVRRTLLVNYPTSTEARSFISS